VCVGQATAGDYLIIVPRHTLVLDQDYHQEKDDVGMVDIAPSHSCLHPWLCCDDIAGVHERSLSMCSGASLHGEGAASF